MVSTAFPYRVYLDYNATSPLRPEVRAAIEPLLFNNITHRLIGNPSSVHWAGQEARRNLEDARSRVASILHRHPSEIIFTSGGSEADNLALHGFFSRSSIQEQPRTLITSAVEHPAVEASAAYWAGRGVTVLRVPVRSDGSLCLTELDAWLKASATAPEATLVSIMAVNNETGIIHDLKTVRELTEAAGVRLHVDAVQAAGRLPFTDWDADLVVISGHKLGALPGSGVLATRSDMPLASMIRGGPQERGKRAGTESVAAATSLAVALELADAHREEEMYRLSELRNQLDSFLCQCPDTQVLDGAPRVAPVSCAVFGAIDGEVLLQALDLEGIAVSSGSACSSGSLEPSSVLSAMGIDAQRARSAVRFSMGHATTQKDLDAVIATLPKLLERARKASQSVGS